MDRHKFYWLIDNHLAGSGRPGNWSRRDGDGADLDAAHAALDADLAWLRDRGIRAILSLTEMLLLVGALARHDLHGYHLPVPDLNPPSLAQLDDALDFLDEQRLLARPTLVHCLVGEGRTGTVLAAYLIRGGLTPDAALRELRIACPNAVGSPAQETFLRDFASRRAWII
jgi:atypical dual specificity phosphatase